MTTKPASARTSPTGEASKQIHPAKGPFQRAQEGDATALPDVRRVYDKYPDVWRQFGQLTKRVQGSLVSQMVGSDLVQQEAITRQLSEIYERLLGASPTPLERLQVDRIVVQWLHVHLLDLAIISPKSGGNKFAEYLLKRHHLATKQYLAAMRELTILRRLLPAGRASAGSSLPEQTTEPFLGRPTLTIVGTEQDSDEPRAAVRRKETDSAAVPPPSPATQAAQPAPVPKAPRYAAPTPYNPEDDPEDVPMPGGRMYRDPHAWYKKLERETEREWAASGDE